MATAEPPPRECDLVVVGAGIVGLAVARELALRHPGFSIAVLEREAGIARHQTGHSSGVVHAGIYYRPGSLKARLCVEGARRLYEYCEQGGIPYERSGKLIVATKESELDGLAKLERRGRENGVPGLVRMGPDELREIEPHAAGLAALHSPETGVVDFEHVGRAFADDLVDAGGSIHLGCPIYGMAAGGSVKKRPYISRNFTDPLPTQPQNPDPSEPITVAHSRGTTRARFAVACAGAWADRLAVAAGAPADPRIVPFRGAYLRLRPERRELVRSLIYPVPDPELPFLGAHLTRELNGEVLLGPTALMVGARDAYRLLRIRPRDLGATLSWPGTWRLVRRHWRTGLVELRHAIAPRSFVAEARRLVPELRADDFVAGPAGIRAQALGRDGSLLDDFVISRTQSALHVRNAPSPAATSSLALAGLIADQVELAL